jgi:hypothetical protein
MRFIISCLLALFLAGLLPPALAAPAERADASKDTGARAFDLDEYRMKETLRLAGPKLETPVVSREELAAQRAGGEEAGAAVSPRSSRNIGLAMLSSAIIPGMGELYVATGSNKISHYLRVPIFIGLDIFFWYSYRDNYDKGKEVKAEYEIFGDAHWSEERFLLQHPYCDGIGGCDSWEQYNEDAKGDYYYFVYIPRHLDHEEYYENMGKYDAFAFGWDDWNGDYNDVVAWTPNRTTYWDMRIESDDYLLKADRYVMALIINRVVSMLDAGYLAYKYNKGDYDDKGLTLEFRPGLEYSAVGLNYRF